MKKYLEVTKENSTLNKADADETLFILRGQDKSAPLNVMYWIMMNWDTCPEEKIREAFECALQMKKEGKKNAD